MSFETFVIKAKTLNLVEIDTCPIRGHVEGCVSDDCIVAEILGGEKHQFLLAEVDAHFSLRRHEAPRQVGRNIAIELHCDGPVGNYSCVGNSSLRCSAKSRSGAKQAVERRRVRD